ncbi:MAG: bifunctional diaminohydroxyphosphoribosylaminopyrimidine deaminase/5-amino-6-(5-phosphoribosylamino)uracil reductase RibD [Phycisphaerales bacterium]
MPTDLPAHTDHADLSPLPMALAARAACRAAGYVEPNPLVGCTLVGPIDPSRPLPVADRIIAVAHHERYGGPHAEALAIARARALGRSTVGATAYVTLEPCNSTGRNPPCVDALLAAGISRVVIARADASPAKGNGAERLRAAGVGVIWADHPSSPAYNLKATRLADTFIQRTLTGTPWVIAKWAQTLDGKVATRLGQSQWISCERSRLRVHRLRARVDAIITAVGTVLADDPSLNARNVPIRRAALRVVIDPDASLVEPNGLLKSRRVFAHTDRTPTALVIRANADISPHALAPKLAAQGVTLLCIPEDPQVPGRIDLRHLLRVLATPNADPDAEFPALRPANLSTNGDAMRPPVANVLLEAGPGLLGSFLANGLVDECQVYVAPTIMGDQEAPSAFDAGATPTLDAIRTFEHFDTRHIGRDLRLTYRLPRRDPSRADVPSLP